MAGNYRNVILPAASSAYTRNLLYRPVTVALFMIRIRKVFLLCLLMLALLVQGISGAFVPHCATYGRQAAALEDEWAAHEHTVPERQHVAKHAHDDEPALADSSALPSQDVDATCSVCAACCTVAFMLMPEQNWHPGHSESIRFLASAAPVFGSFFPEGLERPPRASLV